MKTLLVVLFMSGAAAAQEKPRGGKIEWRQDYQGGLETARREGKVVMLYFTADW